MRVCSELPWTNPVSWMDFHGPHLMPSLVTVMVELLNTGGIGIILHYSVIALQLHVF